jgi:hypothetical protein
MSETLKAEGTKFFFSMLFLVVAVIVLWFAYPKMLEKAGKSQARGYWSAEDEANRKRLFGGE